VKKRREKRNGNLSIPLPFEDAVRAALKTPPPPPDKPKKPRAKRSAKS
jgi:hypothetical protein